MGKTYFSELEIGEQFAHGPKKRLWEKRHPFEARDVTGIADDTRTVNAVRVDKLNTCARFAPLTEVIKIMDMHLNPKQLRLMQIMRDNPNVVLYYSSSYAYLYDTVTKTTEGWFRYDTAYYLIRREFLVYSHVDPLSNLTVFKLAPSQKDKTEQTAPL